MRLIFVLIFILNLDPIHSQEKNDFESPLKIPLILSGTFGELRSNHFHSGIDFKTNKEIGVPIYAPAPGYVSRIKVSPFGFGKAIYVNHENGLTTVYAHLDKFNSEINNYIIKKQYEKKSFSLDLSISKDKFKLSTGDIIAYSGNSGSSTGPHLHFEIRDTKTQHPLNPMNWDFNIKDTKKPIIEEVYIYDLKNPMKITKQKMINDINISGSFAIGIKAHDILDLAQNKNGINTIKIYLNNQLYYHYDIQEFSFNETKYINSLIDFKEYTKNKQRIYKCYVEKNNQLSVYKELVNNGIITSIEEKSHKIKIVVEDSYKNTEKIEFIFNYKNTEKIDLVKSKEIIDCNQDYKFENENLEIFIPKKSLYQDCMFSYKENNKNDNHTEYTIITNEIPLHKKFNLSIKPDENISNPENLIMVRLDKNDSIYVKSKWENNKIVGSPKCFGTFTLTTDEKEPTIQSVNFKYDLSNESSIKFKISDNLSGVDEYYAELNNEWILMEYDPKNNLLEHNFINNPVNKEHKLYLKVSDKNSNFIEKEFYFVR
ncbi:MAG: hypothetical protein CBC73_03440 [Flavobacteriales bacterium TMED113]|nr:MAG: hypothetical protein CBC73_03440 [Flavobacteriales bacterium TMED113]